MSKSVISFTVHRITFAHTHTQTIRNYNRKQFSGMRMPTDFGIFAILITFIYPKSAHKIAVSVSVIVWRSNEMKYFYFFRFCFVQVLKGCGHWVHCWNVLNYTEYLTTTKFSLLKYSIFISLFSPLFRNFLVALNSLFLFFHLSYYSVSRSPPFFTLYFIKMEWSSKVCKRTERDKKMRKKCSCIHIHIYSQD